VRAMDFNVAELHEAIAATRPQAECLVFRDRRLTWSQVTDRTRRLANYLIGQGLGAHTERPNLEGHESGQDHLAIYLYNGNEYLESMLGAFKARVAPFNVNYRYVAEELEYLLNDAGATAIVFGGSFAETLAAVLPNLPKLRVLIQVDDGSGAPLLPGAVEYEAALAASSPDKPDVVWSPDDLYILYTGGTTGMPKGVLWRQADGWSACFGGGEPASLETIVAAATGGLRSLPAPPFMHGAGHWVAFSQWSGGHTVYVQSEPRHFDPADVLGLIERERINFLLIVGDAYGRPLVDHLDTHTYDLSSLAAMISGGAALSAPLKAALLKHIPHLMLIDGLGSSEAGGQMSKISTSAEAPTTGTFPLSPGNAVLSDDLTRVLTPGDPELGWLARFGRLPLGYLGDAEKTARTWIAIGGVRYSVPGDRAKLLEDGTVELHGRDSVTINSGGEKIFAEEIERALRHHPDVYDVVVTGRPSERWGNEVVAVVQLCSGAVVDEDSLTGECAKHVARYKLPKAYVFVESMVRSPSGKADYRWAKQQAVDAA
jgi:acyl-CoA synthetase (AMP-forming)/AMP-acid ligase II